MILPTGMIIQYDSVFHLFIISTAPETPKLKIDSPQQEVYEINDNHKRVKMNLTFQVSVDTITWAHPNVSWMRICFICMIVMGKNMKTVSQEKPKPQSLSLLEPGRYMGQSPQSCFVFMYMEF